MRSPFRISLLMLTLGACAGDVGEPLADESGDLTSSSSSLEAMACPSFSATNSAHVQAGRAYTTSRYVYFRRVTTFFAKGSNENLGTSASVSTTLYELASGSYSLSQTGCISPALPDGAVLPSDAGSPPSRGDASAKADAGAARDASAVDAGALASSGCGLAPPSAGSGKTIVINGASRTYVLALPASYDSSRAYPLIFAFHGLGGSGAQAQLYFGLSQATQGQAVLVYPDATGSSKAWGITGTAATADIALFDELVRTLSASLCIDQSKIFAAGHSMGGYFSNTLGCARGNTLRAIAPVAGGGPYVSCDNGKVAAWLMAALDDPTVSYTAGEASRDKWRTANGCANTTRPVGPSACVAYEGCDAQHPVHWCLESTGGHSWPSYAGQAIWSFFKAL